MTTGFGFAVVTLTTAGIVRVPMKDFIIINLIGGFFWTGFLLTIGYFFGHFYTQIDSGLRLGTSIGFVILLLALVYGLQRYMRSTLTKK
jgi:membrane protein DedA with SNARE-associated domain